MNAQDISSKTQDLYQRLSSSHGNIRGKFSFYCIDISYDSRYPGCILLFGKVKDQTSKSWKSVCVMVQNILRTVYLKLKDSCSFEEVVEELSRLKTYLNIGSKMHIRKCNKKSLFGKGERSCVEEEYIEVKYGFDQTNILDNYKGDSFNHVSGASSDIVTSFIIEKKIKGPSSLVVYSPNLLNDFSWCCYDFSVDDPHNIALDIANPSPDPIFCIMSIKVQRILGQNKDRDDICAISMSINDSARIDSVHSFEKKCQEFTLIKKLPHIDPYFLASREGRELFIENNEHGILTLFLSIMRGYDPDFIVGHDLMDTDLKILLDRLIQHDLPHWSVVGRLKLNKLKIFDHNNIRRSTIGRIICDTKTLAKEFYISIQGYDLKSLCSSILGDSKLSPIDINPNEVSKVYSEKRSLITMCKSLKRTTELNLIILHKMDALRLTRELTNICGNLWYKSMKVGKAERNDFFLMHNFYANGCLIPDKENRFHRKNKKVAGYQGGLVLEPEKGLHMDHVLVMDFKSLYPSLIIEHNICFSTVKRVVDQDGEWVSAEKCDPDIPLGLLPRSIKELIDRRSEALSMLADPKIDNYKIHQLKTRQLALKVVANSIYGNLGNRNARFYCYQIAQLVTALGRVALSNAISVCNTLNYRVLYGDTDSVMICTRTKKFGKVNSIADTIKRTVDSMYNYLEINKDNVFKRLLILKKKKYAALAYVNDSDSKTEIIYRGIDLVRRDTCNIAADLSKNLLKKVMDCRSSSLKDTIISLLSDFRKGLEHHNIVEDFVIRRSLTKNISDYKNANSIPHVKIALNMIRDHKPISVGDIINYVICKGTTSSKLLADRAQMPEYVSYEEIDIDWYLRNQIFQSVNRLCEPLPDIKEEHILAALKIPQSPKTELIEPPEITTNLIEPICIHCSNCSQENIITADNVLDLLQCQFCFYKFSSARLVNQFKLHIRKCEINYSSINLSCTQCKHKTSNVFRFSSRRASCPNCFAYLEASIHNSYMYDQVTFLSDIGQQLENKSLIEITKNALEACEYRIIDLDHIFCTIKG